MAASDDTTPMLDRCLRADAGGNLAGCREAKGVPRDPKHAVVARGNEDKVAAGLVSGRHAMRGA